MTKTVSFSQVENRAYYDKKRAKDKVAQLEYLQGNMVDFREFGPDYCETKEDYEQQISRLDICVAILVGLIFSGSVILLSLAIANCLNMKSRVQKFRHDVDQFTEISKFLFARGNNMSTRFFL